MTQTALMLILDVKTRWSSTHQMLRKQALLVIHQLLITLSVGRALDYRSVIDDFVAKNKDLRKFEMHADDWDAIVLVAQWLKSFRSATTQMSTTKRPMLSSTHAIYRGLQESLRESLRDLPNNTPPQLKLGLTRAHRKLSDYYNKIDDSPYYIWSSCLLSAFFLLMSSSLIDMLTVLDPRISYQGLLADCEDNASLQSHLELSRNHLHAFYHKHYANTVDILIMHKVIMHIIS